MSTAANHDRPQKVLSISGDGTYVLREEGGRGLFAKPKEKTGSWKAKQKEVILYIGNSYVPQIIAQLEGKKLVDQMPGGLVWERQDQQ